MRLAKLAVRTVLSMRASVTASVAVVALVAGVVTIAGSVIVPLRAMIEETVRVRVLGETTLTGEVAGPGQEALAGDDVDSGEVIGAGRTVGAGPPSTDWIASARRVEPGVLDANGELLLVRVSRVDLAREIEFRRLESFVDADELTEGAAVLLAGGLLATTLSERAVRLETPGERRLIRITAVGPPAPGGPELLLHDPASLSNAGTVLRFRGRHGPMDRLPTVLVEAGAAGTGWRARAHEASRPLRRGGAVLAGILTLLAVGTLVPGHLLLVRRARASFSLLHAWGFGRAAIARVVVVMGAFASAAAATVGAGAALGAAAVLNAQARPAASLLPLDLEQQVAPLLAASPGVTNPSADLLAPPNVDPAGGTTAPAAASADTPGPPITPSVGWAAASIAIATLLGAVTALPSSRKAATLGVRRSLWHW